MRYFVLHNKRQYGPFEETEIQELLSAGILTFNDPVAPEGTSKFQTMANTHLIFTSETASTRQIESIPQEAEIKVEAEPDVPDVSVNNEAVVTLDEPIIVCFPETGPYVPLLKKFMIWVQKTCKNFPEFILNRVLPRKHLERTLMGKAFGGFITKIYAWLTLLGVSLLIQQFFFSKAFNGLFKLIFPDAGPTGVSSIGLTAEMIIVFIACTYTLITMALMTAFGAAALYDQSSFSLKELYFKVQPKLLKFCFVLSEFVLLVIILIMGTVLLPDLLQFTEKYVVLILLIIVAKPILAVPFIAMLEDVGIFEAHRISAVLMRRQFKRFFSYALGYTAVEIGIDILAKNYHFCVALKYLLQLFTLIFATYYYKDLSNKTLIRRRKHETR